MQALKAINVRYMVAPYEADALMAYLAKNGMVDAVITEDSDLIAYGCPCVILKLDKAGDCSTVRLADLNLNQNPSFAGFTQLMFLQVRSESSF